MKNIVIVLLIGCALVMTGCISPGENSSLKITDKTHFPEVVGIDLHGEEQTLPDSFAGSLNIVTVAFKRDHQSAVNTWIPVADEIAQTDSGIQFYEIPLIYKMNPAARFWVNNGMRAGIEDPIARARTITVYTDRDKFTEMMQMDIKTIDTLLLNDQGTILWRTPGEATKESIRALKQAIQEHQNES